LAMEILNGLGFYLLIIYILGVFAGPVFRIIGLIVKNNKLAIGGFVAAPLCIVLADPPVSRELRIAAPAFIRKDLVVELVARHR